MTYSHQPIPTRYKDVVYRSRLEANWAVFFTALGFTFEYEKRRFGLLSGWYTPDFRLSKQKVWLEIKPRDGFTDDPLLYKDLAITTGDPVLRIAGSPRVGEYAIYLHAPQHNKRFYPRLTRAVFAESQRFEQELWLLQGVDYCRVGKIWQPPKYKAKAPIGESLWILNAHKQVANFRPDRELKEAL